MTDKDGCVPVPCVESPEYYRGTIGDARPAHLPIAEVVDMECGEEDADGGRRVRWFAEAWRYYRRVRRQRNGMSERQIGRLLMTSLHIAQPILPPRDEVPA